SSGLVLELSTSTSETRRGSNKKKGKDGSGTWNGRTLAKLTKTEKARLENIISSTTMEDEKLGQIPDSPSLRNTLSPKSAFSTTTIRTTTTTTETTTVTPAIEPVVKEPGTGHERKKPKKSSRRVAKSQSVVDDNGVDYGKGKRHRR